MKVFSEEWWNAVVEKVKNDEELHIKAADLEGNFHFRVLKDPKINHDVDAELGVRIPSGESHWYGPKPADELDIIIESKGGNFLDVITGKKNVVIALTMGTLKIKKGALSKLTGNLGGVLRLLEVVGEVPTT
jgi:putative sterol carrier protein